MNDPSNFQAGFNPYAQQNNSFQPMQWGPQASAPKMNNMTYNPNPMPTMPNAMGNMTDWGTGAGQSSDLMNFAGGGQINGQDPSKWQNALGYTDDKGNKQGGYAGLALSGLNAGVSAYMGMKQYGLAKDTFKQNKKEFQMNWDANKKLTNSRLEDRQKMRNLSQPGSHESTASYMAKNGI